MAKDAKGHGSEKRGANTVDTVYSSKVGVGGLGKGMYARTANGQQYKLNAAATNGVIPRVNSTLNPSDHTLVSGQAHTAALAAQHGVPSYGPGHPSYVAPLASHLVELLRGSEFDGKFGKK